MSTSHKLVSEIESELEDLGSELAAVRPLMNKLKATEPDPIEIRAVATTLHAFYNGVEHVFTRIAKRLDGGIPTESNWHRQLLDRMTRETDTRTAVIDTSLYNRLLDYLAFRHFFRHSYPADLQWRHLKPLVEDLDNTHSKFTAAMQSFLNGLRANTPDSDS